MKRVESRGIYAVSSLAVALAAGCQILAGIDDRVVTVFPDGGADAHGDGDDGASDSGPHPPADGAIESSVGPSACTAPMADCNGVPGDGCESDTSSDGLNCGRCGHTCLGGQCAKSACQPFEIATGQNNPVALAVDATYLYFTTLGTQGPQLLSDGAVTAIALNGGGQHILASGLTSPHAIAIDDDRVYWASDNVHNIESIKKGGGGRMTVIGPADSAATSPAAITVDVGYVYWVVSGALCSTIDCPKGGQIFRGYKDGSGGGIGALVSYLAYPTTLVRADTRVYWCERGAGDGKYGALGFVDVTTPGLATGALIAGDCDGLAIRNGQAYFMALDYVQNTQHGALWTIPTAGGSHLLLADLGAAHESFGIAADSQNVYVSTDISGGGAIQRTSITGGIPVSVGRGEGLSNVGMVIDDTSIYWASTAEGKVLRLAK